MLNNKKKNCIRCLLREMDAADAKQRIEEYKKTISPSLRSSSSLYEERLSICKDCKWLSQGTCRKCGAYVEARAYQKDKHCPLGEKLW